MSLRIMTMANYVREQCKDDFLAMLRGKYAEGNDYFNEEEQ